MDSQKRVLADREFKLQTDTENYKLRLRDLVQREANCNAQQKKLNCDIEKLEAAISAFEKEKSLFSPPALSPTFDTLLFSDTMLGEALLHYDYENNSRLFTALKTDIVLHKQQADIVFTAKSDSGAVYTVSLNSCTCPDFQFRHQPCKHMYSLAVALGWVSQSRETQIKLKENQFNEFVASKRRELETTQSRMRHEISALEKRIDSYKNELSALIEQQNYIQQLISDTPNVFPCIAAALADYHYSYDLELSKAIRQKPRPAIKAADDVKRIAKEKRELFIELNVLKYKMDLYEAAAPWLKDMQLSAADIKEAVEYEQGSAPDEYTLLRNWLSPDEYKNLSNAEKYQLALDRYKKRNKSNWAAGIEYERYIGYLFEQKGFRVYYSGALKGVEDLGRDVIAVCGNEAYIVQCKRWAASKEIHEKHIFQLFGSTFEYRINNPLVRVEGILVATCPLSPKAALYANELGIEYRNVPYDQDYPVIKCNVSNNGNIYHLPFDQQYDRVVIDSALGEFYASTVIEAESKGFVRAKHWSGTNK